MLALVMLARSAGCRPIGMPRRPPIQIPPDVSIHVPPTESIHMPSRMFNATSPPDVALAPALVPALVPVVAFIGVLAVVTGVWLHAAATATPAAMAIRTGVRFFIIPPRD